MGEVVATFALVALALLLVSAGIEDARARNIANWKNAAVALLAPVWWVASGLAFWPDMAMQVGLAFVVLLLFTGAFAIGQMGGGDVKLLAALALWLPVQPFMSMIMMMALLGGGLTLLMVAEQWVRRRQGMPRMSRPAMAALLALVAGAVALSRPGVLATLRDDPMLWTLVLVTALAAVSVLLLLTVRSARKRGLLPEIPYGVAIAIAALLILREPILNHFG